MTGHDMCVWFGQYTSKTEAQKEAEKVNKNKSSNVAVAERWENFEHKSEERRRT
jgi:hypothetical protein